MPRTDTSAKESAHDVLAAEAFAVPGPDPVLHHEPLRLPEDPTGIAEPHDILAAEEFAMPAGQPNGVNAALARRSASRWRLIAVGAVAVLALRALRRGRRRGRPRGRRRPR